MPYYLVVREKFSTFVVLKFTQFINLLILFVVMLKINFYKNKVAGNENYGKVYGRVETADPMSLEQLAEHMADHGSPYSKGVIKGILSDMVHCIQEKMLDGVPVKLDDLAIFTPSVISKPAESAEKYDLGTHIKSVKMTARATGDMRKAILTKTARLGYTSLAQRVKAGELTLSSTKGEYIEGSGTNSEPTVNP